MSIISTTIDSTLLARVTGGRFQCPPKPHPAPDIRSQCGLPPKHGSSSRDHIVGDFKGKAGGLVGRLVGAGVTGHVDITHVQDSDYKTCVDGVTGR